MRIELFYKGTILQKEYWKMKFFCKFHCNFFEPQHDVIYANLCSNKVCYKGTALFATLVNH